MISFKCSDRDPDDSMTSHYQLHRRLPELKISAGS